MSYSGRSRYLRSPSPHKRYNGSLSRSKSRSRSRSYGSSDVENPGNNLYVTGLSTRVTKRDLEKHFSTEGKVENVHLVVDPLTRESRGFGFVTMSTLEEAERCIKYLDRSVLEGRVITVEKARRRRGRTPTPGRYLGLRTAHARRRSPSYLVYSRSCSPRESFERDRSRSRSYSPCSRHCHRSYLPYRRSRLRSPYCSRRRTSCSRSRSPSYSRSPYSVSSGRSYSPFYHRDYSPNDRYCRSRHGDFSPNDRYHRRSRYRSITPPRYRRYSMRNYSRSVSRSYSRSASPKYSMEYSPSPRKNSAKGFKRSTSPGSDEFGRRAYSGDSRSSGTHSRSTSVSSSSRS